MNLSEIFKDSLKYPISDMTKFCIFGVVMLLSALSSLNFENDVLTYVFSVISLVALIISLGYGVAITRNAINKSSEIPDLDLKTNIVDGLKMIVLYVEYFIIPTIIVVILAFATGLFDKIFEIASYYTQYGAEFANMVPDELVWSMVSSASIVILVAFILFIIFVLLYYMGMCRLAKYNSLSEGADILESARDLRRVGIGRIIVWGILICIVTFIGSIIEGFLGMIPYIGVLIAGFLVSTYVSFVAYRSVGLLYSEI